MGLWEETAEEMYQHAISRPLGEKVEQAIALIRSMENQALQLSDDGFYVCFSGGKDSVVMAKLFEMAGVAYTLNYSNVTIDPPELVRFIKREYPQAIWHSQDKPLPLAMADKSCGPPTRLIRWCCEKYKEQGGYGLFKSIGVRAAESPRRKGLWKTVNNNNGGKILAPIVYWSDADVWRFIRENGIAYCELYDEGFTRLGCVGCPMGGPRKQQAEFKRWPGYERMWKRGFQAYWDKYKGTLTKAGEERSLEKFPTVEALWNWWISGKAYEGEQSDCQMWLW